MTTALNLVLLMLAMSGSPEELHDELWATEMEFARTAAERDIDGFTGFLAPDAVFSGSGRELRGPAAIRDAWAPFFDPEGPSIWWQPESVSVLDDGGLGMSRGPYRIVTRNEAGEEVTLTGTFFSVWRRTEDGWKIILDGGTPATPETDKDAMMSERSAELAAGWIDAWIRMDMEWLWENLAPDFVHTSPFGRLEGREYYLETVEPLARKSVTELEIKEIVATGNQAAIWFENRTANGVVETCDWVRIGGDKIQEIRSFYDPAPIRETLSPTEQDDLDGGNG